MGNLKRVWLALTGLFLSLLAVPAFAVIDVTTATDGISGASVAVLAVIAALTVFAVGVWGYRKVLRMFSLPNPSVPR